MKHILLISSLLFCSCETSSKPVQVDVANANGSSCIQNLDSTTKRLSSHWNSCDSIFRFHQASLVRIDIATSGFVNSTIRYWLSAGRVDSSKILPNGSMLRKTEDNPVSDLLTELSQVLCLASPTDSTVVSATLSHAEFAPGTALPIKIEIRYHEKSGQDIDAITGWSLDSAVWKP